MAGRRWLAGLALGAVLAGCATSSSGPAPSPVASGPIVTVAMLGEVFDGRAARASVAGVAPLPGREVVAYVDREEAALRALTAAGGTGVLRRGFGLDIRMPGGIAFDFNAITVKATYRATLDGIAATLARFPATFVDVGGHSDGLGSDAVNQRLSQERAVAVADYLVARGVQRGRIAARGFGKSQPLASNADAAGRAANRRVDIHLSPIIEDDLRRTRRG